MLVFFFICRPENAWRNFIFFICRPENEWRNFIFFICRSENAWRNFIFFICLPENACLNGDQCGVHTEGSSFFTSLLFTMHIHVFHLFASILRTWCKTIVTSYIKWGSYNSFARSPRFVLYCIIISLHKGLTSHLKYKVTGHYE